VKIAVEIDQETFLIRTAHRQHEFHRLAGLKRIRPAYPEADRAAFHYAARARASRAFKAVAPAIAPRHRSRPIPIHVMPAFPSADAPLIIVSGGAPFAVAYGPHPRNRGAASRWISR
jgi:hypothetical protein